MMLPGETVTVLTGVPAANPDPYSGDPVVDWTQPPATEVDIEGVLCEPRPSAEPVQDARNSVTSGYTLYVRARPVMPVILPSNRVRVRGTDYDVLGEPSDWRMGAFGGLVVQTSRTAG